MLNEMKVLWKAREKNGIDMLLSKGTEYWLVLQAGIEDGTVACNPSIEDLEALHKAITTELLTKKVKK